MLDDLEKNDDVKAVNKAHVKAHVKSKSKNKLLGQGSYGCVYYPGISCSGKMNKKKTVTKLQEISFYSVNEITVGKYIKKHVPKYSSMYAPIIKHCVVSFQTIHKSELNIFDCKTLFPDNKNSNSSDYDYIDSASNDYNDYLDSNSESYKSKLNTKYYLMYMNYIVNRTFKKYFEGYKLFHVYVVDLINTSLYIIKSIGLLVSANIIHNDLHVNNILINLKNNKPIIIDFGLSMFYDKCFKYQKKTIDFEYLKYLLFDFREDQYHIILEKRFLSFITNNNSDQYNASISTNFARNDLTQSIIDIFIVDAYDSISNQNVIPFNKVELAEYYKSLKEFYYQFLNKYKYPNYSVIISYLLKFLFKYTDLYSIVFNIYYMNLSTVFVRGERESESQEDFNEEVKVGGNGIYKEDFSEEDSLKYSNSKPLFDFFMVLFKKNLHPKPLMRLHSSEITKIFNYIIETIKKSETVVSDRIFIKELDEFLVSQSINPKIIFNKNFAYLDFGSILSSEVREFVKKHF